MKKLIVANRGEIAIRVFRAAREMGIRTVAVASDADKTALHTSFADEVVRIGGNEPATSYLNPELILNAAKSSGSDAIHPGYGFLSERAEFARACASQGVNFVGPTAEAMDKLGDKIASKNLAIQCDVPITPGYFEPGASDADLKKAALEIGLPVMLKASAGGGGRGMRRVDSAEQLDQEISTARSEAKAGFGSDEMMVEKLIIDPRHIEVQVISDKHGNVAALFERECSVQRRHQKVIEEAPSAVISDAIWQPMRAACIRLMQAAGYENAGTVEFMYDEKEGKFYFLEVNARLQVEHPVTEAITGLDLVQLQLLVTMGEDLTNHIPKTILEGDRSAIHGHAIEARVVAEDPYHNFVPSIGTFSAFELPSIPGVRVDSGYAPGKEMSRYYDSLVAKVIAHAPNRKAACNKLASALSESHMLGVKVNIPFLIRLLEDSEFQAAQIDTGFLARREDLLKPDDVFPPELLNIMLASKQTTNRTQTSKRAGIWDASDSFRVTAGR